MPLTTLVALATYNEIESLPSLIDAIRTILPAADVRVIDDNSPDGTGRWADERAAVDAQFSVRHRTGKLGLGSAMVAALQSAIEDNYDVVVILDADWSHPPERIAALVELIDAGADVAVGSRYVPGGRSVVWPTSRRVASTLGNTAARSLLRLPVRDCSGAMRAYRVETLRRIDWSLIRSTGYAFLEELLWRLKHAGATFAEAPITFTERRAGASKINRSEALGAGGLLLKLGAAERLGRSPRPHQPR